MSAEKQKLLERIAELEAENEELRAAGAVTEEERIEGLAAAAEEWHAHGSADFEELRGKADPYTGMSEYDYDPGVEYNDAGEPKGYM